MRTRTDNSFMPRIGIAQIAIESKTCPSDLGNWYARFNNKGIWTHVHIENKIKRTPIHYILSHQDEYEVIADLQEYCLYRKGDIIDYSGIWKDLHPFEYENDDSNYTTHDYYMNNPDIFNGEIM